ncbi:hypothetical protein ABH920_003276 [Catenulispora sp. EB89]|uniref:DUF4352 domain-containing protein n=1 Tax=Catenulispora sp. EB89 TaxID=3156257 RepID=UPI00351616FA
MAAAGCASQGVTAGQAADSGAISSPPVSVTSGTDSPSAVSSSSSASPADSASSVDQPPSDSSTSASAPGKLYKLTDTVTEGGFTLKINSITMPWNPPAGAQFTPAPTRSWLMMDFTVTNVSGAQSMFDTIGAFDLRDNANASHLTSVVPGDTLPAGKLFQDHEVKPGETARGEVVFDLPQNGGPFRLIFKGNMWHASQNPPSISLSK